MGRRKWVALLAAGLILLTVVGGVVAAFAGSIAAQPRVAVLYLYGPIAETASLLSPQTVTPRGVRRWLRRAEEDPSIVAVVLRIDSPGGAVGASQAIARLVREFPKPVVASLGDTAVSGAYYIASQADRIVAEPGTLTGSIGVIFILMDLSGLLEKWGVDLQVVKVGRHKDLFLPRPLTPERRALLQALVDRMYEQFVEAVAEGRGLPVERVRELATGEPFTGDQARDLGLVDALGGLERAVEEAKRLAGVEEAEVVELAPSLLERLFGPGGGLLQRLPLLFLDRDLLLLQGLLIPLSGPRYGLW